MKTPIGKTARAHRMLAGILATLLLALPATAADWKSMTPPPVPTGYAAVETINGVIYVAGGWDYNGGGANATLQAFNPETNSWTSLANMPLTLYEGDGAGVINGQLYVAGGWNGYLPTDALLMYDPPSNTWTYLPSMPLLSGGGATGVINSQLYVTTPEDGYDGYYNFLDMYDPLSGIWTSLAQSANAHANPAFGVIDGLLYVAGGVNGNAVVTNVLEAYNPATNSWTTLAPMKTAVQSPASIALNGKLYVFGGNDGTNNVATVQVYDPYKNKWTILSSSASPGALSGWSGVSVYGLAFVEGDTGLGTTNEYFAFLPSIP
jgi:N-acetylneuraminic acid mutarotase